MLRWVERWGFWGGLAHWFETFSDPISAAANIDLIALALFVGVWMIVREKGWSKVLSIILIPYILFPSFGYLLYLIMSDKNLPGDNLRDL